MTLQLPKPRRQRRPARAPLPARADAPLPTSDDSMEGLQPHPGRRMTEQEFLAWVGEKTRAEWVEGEVIIMSPVNTEHDDLQGWLNALLRLFVEERNLGRVCGSELAVRLHATRRQRRLTDLFFVATGRETQFSKTAFEGPPDLIVEVVSPDSTTRDYSEKRRDYESAGVREYWIVDPLSKRIVVHDLHKGAYRPIPEKNGALRSRVLRGLALRPAWLFPAEGQRRPKIADILRTMKK